jgi:hypothetical protein
MGKKIRPFQGHGNGALTMKILTIDVGMRLKEGAQDLSFGFLLFLPYSTSSHAWGYL